MLPLRLSMEGFGSFREPTDVDFADADYFALVGPTGAGKTTVIDAICFALYGTVPRWGRENVVSLALPPSATRGQVALVFEVGARRFGVARVLVRGRTGVVTTREARLDELDPAVPASAGRDALLSAVVRPLAEGSRVTGAVEQLVGLRYRHFTQCVVLPQGRFAEVLHATARHRQDLLVELLGAGLFRRVQQRAAREEEAARGAADLAAAELAGLGEADEAAERAAGLAVRRLAALGRRVEDEIAELAGAEREVRAAERDHVGAEGRLAALRALRPPGGLGSLARQVRAADTAYRRLGRVLAGREDERDRAEAHLAGLGDRSELARARQAHVDAARLHAQQADLARAVRAAGRTLRDLSGRVERAEAELADAEHRRELARDQNAAADLAARLHHGGKCPVCLRTVTRVPDHPVPADLYLVTREVEQHRDALGQHRHAHRQAEVRLERMKESRSAVRERLAELAPLLTSYPDRDALEVRAKAIEDAEENVRAARAALRSARREHADAEERRTKLRSRSEQAWRQLQAARDTVVVLDPPSPDPADPQRAWLEFLRWRDSALPAQRSLATALLSRLDSARRAFDERRAGLAERLARDGVQIPDGATPTSISAAVATAAARAAARLDQVRDRRRRARELAGLVERHRETARVAHELAQLLRANNFEKWLCTEALGVLVEAANGTLRELSGGQYELDLDERGEIEIIDYGEAGLRRSARTLSGGETFQAALALALALSEQVAGFAATAARSLDSIFLDEGFGSLDAAALDTVAVTLERLVAGSERMVGVVTHVPALAERVPTRFEVSRDATGSRIRRVT